MGQFTNRERSSNFSADMSHRPTPGLKKKSMEAAGCFLELRCVNMLKSALSNASACERFQTPVDCVGRQAESAEICVEKCVGRKVARESCSSVQEFIEF